MTTPAKNLPAPNAPDKVARAWLAEELTRDNGVRLLIRWRGDWWWYSGRCWVRLSREEMEQLAYTYLRDATFVKRDAQGGLHAADWNVDDTKVRRVLSALASLVLVPDSLEPGAWLDGRTTGVVVPFQNGLLDLASGELLPHTPAYLGTWALAFDFDDDAACPQFEKFLQDSWPDDEESKRLLRQWFGYVLSGRTDLQKIMVMLGAKRSGKGTIARLLTELLGGVSRVRSPGLAELGDKNIVASLKDAPLAVLSDARMVKGAGSAAIETILRISGEDAVTIDEKYKDPRTLKLPARLMILGNEQLQLRDSSGALTARFLILPMVVSWVGREDFGLEKKLLAELAGIANWALDGLDDLDSLGGVFTVPATAADLTLEQRYSASPMQQWLDEKCLVHPEVWEKVDTLYRSFLIWLEQAGEADVSRNTFGIRLRAALPAVVRRQVSEERTPAYIGVCLNKTHNHDDDRTDGAMRALRKIANAPRVPARRVRKGAENRG